jgi:arylformamidase
MTAIDFEAQYNNRALVPEHPAIIEGWARDAADFRDSAEMEADFAYGPRPRNRMDLFFPDNERRADRLAVFIHGGYWQGLDKSFFSHMAAGCVARGVCVAIVGYTLCPEVTIGDIVDEIRLATRVLWGRFAVPIAVSGHSAGGHLAAAMLATDWGETGPVVSAVQPISGVFELEPLVHTSLNGALHLDAAEAARQSPLLWSAPTGGRLHAWVGGAESDEFLRQSHDIVEKWGRSGVETRFHAPEGANHFTVIAPLADAQSEMTRDLADLATPK